MDIKNLENESPFIPTWVIITLIAFVIFFGALLINFVENQKGKSYCGIVQNMFKTPPAYKVNEKCFIVYYNEELKRNVTVQVNYNTYYNKRKGDTVCFHLTKYDLSN